MRLAGSGGAEGPLSQSNQELRVILAEDEELARELLTRYIVANPRLKLVGLARDGEEALQLLQSVDCDVLFLDIELPLISGFGVLERLDRSPYVVFTTSHREFALDAFEVGAIDFLVKPIAAERFQKAVDRLSSFFQREAQQAPPARRHGLFVTERESNYYVPYRNIVYLSSRENYCAIHTSERDYVTYRSLKAMEDRLPREEFVRIYKQYIVNVRQIERIQSNLSGGYEVYLRDEDATCLPVGRAYMPRLRELMD